MALGLAVTWVLLFHWKSVWPALSVSLGRSVNWTSVAVEREFEVHSGTVDGHAGIAASSWMPAES